MATYIASDEKYKGLIKEDIFIRDYFISRDIHSEIITLDEIIDIVKLGDTVILKSIWGYHLHYRKFLKQVSILRKKILN